MTGRKKIRSRSRIFNTLYSRRFHVLCLGLAGIRGAQVYRRGNEPLNAYGPRLAGQVKTSTNNVHGGDVMFRPLNKCSHV